MDKTALGDRMKANYESRAKQFLPRRTNTIIRLDGKAFHTYTRGLDKPFDEGLIEDMQQTAIYLCENIQGAKCAYTQSDEISLLLTDYDSLQTEAWFDGNVQKICSVSSSLATGKFNIERFMRLPSCLDDENNVYIEDIAIYDSPLAFFDSRCFTIPEKEEVVNYFLWRQRDAERNSISMLAQSLYSHKELHKKNVSELQELCFQKGHNWNDLHYSKKRGSLIIKNTYINEEGPVKVYPETEGTIVGGLELYPKDSRKDMHEDVCRRFAPTDEGRDRWINIPIEKKRTKWEIVETPIFSKDRNSILKLMP